MDDTDLYAKYLDAAKTGGKENAHAGLRAVFELGVVAERERVAAILTRLRSERERYGHYSDVNGCAALSDALEELRK